MLSKNNMGQIGLKRAGGASRPGRPRRQLSRRAGVSRAAMPVHTFGVASGRASIPIRSKLRIARASRKRGVRPEPSVKTAIASLSCARTLRNGSPSNCTTRRAMAGAGSSQITGQGASGQQALHQQGVVCATEDDDIGPPAVIGDKAGLEFGQKGRHPPAASLRAAPQPAPRAAASRRASPGNPRRTFRSGREYSRAPRCRASPAR